METEICPQLLIDPETVMLLDWHKHHLNGVLPVTGGLLDQSAFYVEAMQVVDAAIASEQAAAAAAARARAGRKGRARV